MSKLCDMPSLLPVFFCHISKLPLVFNFVAVDFCQLKGSRLNHYLMTYGIRGGIAARKTFVLLEWKLGHLTES